MIHKKYTKILELDKVLEIGNLLRRLPPDGPVH